jgi:hypothetical protein
MTTTRPMLPRFDIVGVSIYLLCVGPEGIERLQRGGVRLKVDSDGVASSWWWWFAGVGPQADRIQDPPFGPDPIRRGGCLSLAPSLSFVFSSYTNQTVCHSLTHSLPPPQATPTPELILLHKSHACEIQAALVASPLPGSLSITTHSAALLGHAASHSSVPLCPPPLARESSN